MTNSTIETTDLETEVERLSTADVSDEAEVFSRLGQESGRRADRIREMRTQIAVMEGDKANKQAEIDELNVWVRNLQTENRELLGRLNRCEEIEESLHNKLATASDAIGAAQYERDAMASVLLYSFEHMDAAARQRVFGFWDAVMA